MTKASPTSYPALRAAAVMLLSTIAFSYLITTSLFCLDISVTPWQFPLSILLAFAASVLCGGTSPADRRTSLTGALAASLLIAILIPICGILPDYSHDGNFYHQEIIVYLLDGWNPVTNPIPVEGCSLWSIHYSKGLEIIEACVAATTGYIETGKVVNLIIITGVALASFIFIHNYFPTFSRTRLTLSALVVTLNPVGLSQLTTFYIDYAAYYLMLLAIMMTIELSRRITVARALPLIALIIVSAGVKLTAFFYTGLAIIMVGAWLIYRRYPWPKLFAIAALSIAGALAGLLLFGYHPYMTNLLSQGNPFYPLVGEGAVDIMTSNTPQEFNCDRFTAFLRSLSSIVIPTVDSRAGGFGPFMIPLLLMSAAALTFTRSRYRAPLRYAAILSLLSCFIFGQSWWARYNPQLWLIPSVGFLAAEDIITKSWRKLLVCGIASCALLTGGICAARGIFANIRIKILRDAIYREFGKTSRPVTIYALTPPAERHFAEKGLEVLELIPENANPQANQPNTPYRAIGFYGNQHNTPFPRVILESDMQLSDFNLDSGLPRAIGLDTYLFTPDQIFPPIP